MKLLHKCAALFAAGILASCSNSVTNVYDYYLKNVVETHKTGENSTSSSRLLLRVNESTNKAQVELIAFKADSVKYLVIGSHKVAKAFYIHDSLYHFDVNDLYSRVRGDDFIRQMGDLSVFFTHIPAGSAAMLEDALPGLKSKYTSARPGKDEVVYIDYTVAYDVIVSFEKRAITDKPTECVLWVGKRKHIIDTADLEKALTALRSF
jgi:hypothetical protein